MTDAAIIAGSLVDAKNVNSHKCMRLIIDVPAENALKVIAAFGWPTMVNPVSVAVARLEEGARRSVADPAEETSFPGNPSDSGNKATSGRNAAGAAASTAARSPAQIAGYLCTLGSFQKFLREKFLDAWNKVEGVGCLGGYINATDRAAACVREICEVDSRAEITKDNALWSALLLAYRLWEKEAEVLPA